ncbi:MAG: DUF885 domain-containing protein [Eubacterium sp.]|nr:DUF885 domain-containing protein [Eubacterium sp.]
MKKKLAVVLLALLMLASLVLTSCGKGEKPAEQGTDYFKLMKEYQAPEKNYGNTADDAAFDEFLDKVFREGMEADFMTMHFSVVDYKSYGIEKPTVDLGEIAYAFDQENFDYMEDQLKELQSFDYSKLSLRQQYDYDALEYSLYETLASLPYYRYNFLFSSGSNIPEALTGNFTDYTFYDAESVDDYLTCLADVDRYLDDCLTYTDAQAKDGLPPMDSWIDYTEDTCKGVLNKTEDNALITTFDERIDALSFLDDSQKAAYKEKNKGIVLDEVLPAYKKVQEQIETYRGKADAEDYVLCNLDKDYAELTYMLAGSSNDGMDEIFQGIKDHLSEMEASYSDLLYDDKAQALYEKASGGQVEPLELVSRECLDYLKGALKSYYPDLGDVEYDVQELDPDTAPATAVAYYWSSPVDNQDQNIIRTNPNNMIPGFETYGTLAHEGFPGHLYQHVFYQRTDPHEFRSVISFIGYTEGWAVNAQKYAFRFGGIDNDVAADALYFEDAYYFALYSIVDIGVNYYGWTAEDVLDYFRKESVFFQLERSDAKEIRDFMIEMPGVYCSYGLGSMQFAALEESTKKAMGDKFDYPAYHEVLMKHGPQPFQILRSAVDDYIAGKAA